MIYNLTKEQLNRYAREFYFETGRTEDSADLEISEELDINLIVSCIANYGYRLEVAGSKMPDNEVLIIGFEAWLKPKIRKDKLEDILPFI